jgi:hypothetical protein
VIEEMIMNTHSSSTGGAAHGTGAPKRFRTLVAAWVAAAAALALAATPAQADLRIIEAGGGTFNADGTSASQAAAHPDSTTTFFHIGSSGFLRPDPPAKDVVVDLPAGLVGNPTAVPTECTNEQFQERIRDGHPMSCPVDAQVGVVHFWLAGFDPDTAPFYTGFFPVYKLTRLPGTPATFGIPLVGQAVNLVPKIRTGGDYGLTVVTRNLPKTGNTLGKIAVTFWGTPADPVHDPERYCPGQSPIFFAPPEGRGCSSTDRPVPLLTSPSNCAAGPFETKLSIDSWFESGNFTTASFATDTNGNPTAVTGCEDVPFDPAISVEPTSTKADSPTGLDVQLTMPTDGLLNPTGLAQSPLRDATVTLPEGMTISPSSADGLGACSDAQLDVNGAGPSTCPDASKIGTVSIETPLLENALEGGVYIRSQGSNDPASGDMFRLAIVVDDADTGIRLKLPGRVAADPDTGRLVTTFEDNPQIPFSKLHLRLKSGPRAPLATPADCGTKTVTSQLSSWSGQSRSVTDSFTIDCAPGAGGFSPRFEAGSLSPVAGAFSPFVARIDRADRERFLSGVSVDMPKGLVAKLRGVPLCGSVQAANGGCPAGSRVGTATVGAGSGSNPFYLQGPVYLTESYKGAPYGLSAQVHVKAGPFDLGTVIVRQAIQVDPETAEISIVSDPLPQVVKGVPVRLRSVNVDVDRPGFTINPTSCAEKRIGATLTSIDGLVHSATSRFQSADCASLAFKPRLAMRLTGRKQRRTGGHPGLNVTLRQASGQANLKGLAVKLPRSLALDPDNAQGLCSFEEARKADPKCPASSVVGKATAYTPVLNKPLSGPVYFAENKRTNKFGRQVSTLPSLVIALRGEVAINVRQSSDVKGGRLISTTATIPDAPVTRFDLRLKGGSGGILTVTRTATRRFDVCKGRHTALVESDGQNGRRADFRIRVKSPCGKAKTGSKAKRKRN